jgi:hypothetical protein
MIKKSLLILVLLILACAERSRDNPFDPTGDIKLNLQVLSFDKKVELSWQNPSVEGYTGFNIYRKAEGLDNSFKKIASGIAASQRFYQDRDITYGYTYSYYLTITGVDIESKPTEQVSILPGPGLNWIADKWGYQIVKTTYDLMHPIFFYQTNWPPTNLAISAELNHVLILYLDTGMMEKITLNGEYLQAYSDIGYPYDIAYEPQESLFWIIDSSGALYTLDTRTDQFKTITTGLSKPTAISIAPLSDLISVVDRLQRKIFQFRHDGSLYQTISRTNGKWLSGPTRYEIDEVHDREWLIDRNEEIDYIYTKSRQAENFNLIDSVYFSGDLAINALDGTCWYLSYNAQNSAVLQLSPDGTRQSEIDGFYNPYDIQTNPYDGTLIVVDSGRHRVIHYDETPAVLGLADFFNFPVKIRIE